MNSVDLHRSFYLPRLPRTFYQAAAVVHWELSVDHRKTGWLDAQFNLNFRETLLHTCVRQALVCPTYCLMPDHLHLILMGTKMTSDQLAGMAFLRTHLKRALENARFQHQAYDHVLRDEERLRNSFARTCGYILENPLKAGLVARPEEWPYSGAMVPGYPALHPLEPKFWEKFWKVYAAARDPKTGKIKRPPIHMRRPTTINS